ncbi:MAG: hypothetical protein UU87_C0003G0157 [Parcubacteria group bacterium GW2011_GWA2_42_11]|nr:MAG: hypothetical protein UU87_C0003G0157 [Parcubacteria group bacterium GW2011_GWA2_42_11]
MPFKDQKHKWFSILIFIALPFIVFYRLIKGELPRLRN